MLASLQTVAPALTLAWALGSSSGLNRPGTALQLKVQTSEALPCPRAEVWVEALRAQLGARAEIAVGAADFEQAQLLITLGPQRSLRLWFLRSPQLAPAFRDLQVGEAGCKAAARAVAIIAASWLDEQRSVPTGAALLTTSSAPPVPPVERQSAPPPEPLDTPPRVLVTPPPEAAPFAPMKAKPGPESVAGWPLRLRPGLRLAALGAVGADGSNGGLGLTLAAESLVWGPVGLGVRGDWLSPLSANDPQTRAPISVKRYQLGAFAQGDLLADPRQRLSVLAGAELSILDATSQPPLVPGRQTQVAVVPFCGLLFRWRWVRSLGVFAEGEALWRPASAGFYTEVSGNPLPVPLIVWPSVTLQLAVGLAWGD